MKQAETHAGAQTKERISAVPTCTGNGRKLPPVVLAKKKNQIRNCQGLGRSLCITGGKRIHGHGLEAPRPSITVAGNGSAPRRTTCCVSSPILMGRKGSLCASDQLQVRTTPLSDLNCHGSLTPNFYHFCSVSVSLRSLPPAVQGLKLMSVRRTWSGWCRWLTVLIPLDGECY